MRPHSSSPSTGRSPVAIHWRLVSVAITGGTAIAYAFYILRGWETMDLVGLLTTTIEFAAALMVVSPVTCKLALS